MTPDRGTFLYLKDNGPDIKIIPMTFNKNNDKYLESVNISENDTIVNVFYVAANDNTCVSYVIQGDTIKNIDTCFKASFLANFKFDKIIVPTFSKTPIFFVSVLRNFCSDLPYLVCKTNSRNIPEFEFKTEVVLPTNCILITTETDYFYVLFVITLLLTVYGIGFIYLRTKYPRHFVLYDFNHKKISSLKNKILELENISDNLYLRSNVMLFVGLVLGIGGMIVAIYMFDSTYESVRSFQDAGTIIKLIRNIIFLFFVETFAFFFFKQYRVNYNEFKIFKGAFMKMINYLQIIELSDDENKRNEKLIEMFANEKIDLFDNASAIKIDEFNDELLKKALDIIGQQTKK